MNYSSVQRGEDLKIETGDHVHSHRQRVYTDNSVNENYHRVPIR